MAPPAEKKKASATGTKAAASAGKKENKPPAAASATKAKPASDASKAKTAPKAAAAPAKKPETKKPAPAPAAQPKAEKKPAPEAPKAAAVAAAPAEAKKPKTDAKKEKKPAKKAVAKKPATSKQVLRGKNVTTKKKKVASRFIIDCTLPAEDQLFNCSDFERFLRERIKINGKTSNFGNALSIEKGDKNSKIIVNATCPFSKRYLKYLTKKYLKKNLLRDTLRVISTSRDGYELRYFQIGNEADDDEEDNE